MEFLSLHIQRRPNFWAAVVLIFLGVVCYHNAVFHPFVHDDFYFIHSNPNLQNFNIFRIFARDAFSDVNSPIVNAYYRPFLEVVYFLSYKLFGLNAAGYHALNIVLHIVNSCLVFLIARFLFNKYFFSALSVAIFFLVHPVQTESVACISGISNLIYAFFCLFSFYTYLRFRESGNRTVLFAGMSFIFFVFALLSKEQAAIFPAVIFMYEVFFTKEKGFSLKQSWKLITGFVLLLAGYFLLRHFALGTALDIAIQSSYEFKLRMMAIAKSLMTHIKIVFFPFDLHYYRSTDILEPLVKYWVMLGGVSVLLVMAIISVPKNLKKHMLFGVSWFLIFLLPLLNFFPLFNEYSLILTAEHFLYLPLFGIMLALVAGTFAVKTKYAVSRSVLQSLLAIFMVVCIVLTIRQNTYWRSETQLFKRTVKHEPRFGKARLLLGNAFFNDGKFDQGIQEYENALGIIQGYYDRVEQKDAKNLYRDYLRRIHRDLIFGYEVTGDPKRAEKNYDALMAFDGAQIDHLNSLGIKFINIGLKDKAALYFQKAYEMDDTNLVTLNNLAAVYAEIGERQKAETLFEKILKLYPDSDQAQKNLNHLRGQ